MLMGVKALAAKHITVPRADYMYGDSIPYGYETCYTINDLYFQDTIDEDYVTLRGFCLLKNDTDLDTLLRIAEEYDITEVLLSLSNYFQNEIYRLKHALGDDKAYEKAQEEFDEWWEESNRDWEERNKQWEEDRRRDEEEWERRNREWEEDQRRREEEEEERRHRDDD